jgi:hypothetical protein
MSEIATKIVVSAEDRATSSLQKITKQLDSMTGAVKGMALLGSGTFSIRTITDALMDAAQVAGRYEALGVTLHAVGKANGYAALEVDGHVNALRRLGISGEDARQTIIKLMQSQADLSNAPALARMAKDVGAIAGIDSSQALEKLVKGVQSAQTETLRNIGINVNFEQSYARLAQQLGKTAKELTEEEKIQARLNAVIEAGDAIAGSYDATLGKLGRQMSDLSIIRQDLAVDLGTVISRFAEDAGIMDSFMSGMERLSRFMLERRSRAAGLTESDIASAGNVTALREMTEGAEAAAKEIAQLEQIIAGLSAKGIDVSEQKTQLELLKDVFFGTRAEIAKYEEQLRQQNINLELNKWFVSPAELEGYQQSNSELLRLLDALRDKLEKSSLSVVSFREVLHTLFAVTKDKATGKNNEEHVDEYVVQVRKAEEETNKLFTKTKEWRENSLKAAVEAARKNNELLHNDASAAVLRQAEDNLAKFYKTGSGGARATESALTSLTAKVEELRARLNDDKGDTFLAKSSKDIAEFERKIAGMKGTKKEQALSMLDEYKSLSGQYAGKEKDKQLQQAMQVRIDFEREYANMVGLSADAVSKSLQRQYDDYYKSGVDIVQLEEWKADKIRRASRSAFDGAYVYLQDFSNDALNMSKNTTNMLSSIFDGVGNAFEITTEGMKFNWQNMLNQMLNAAAKALVINPLMGGLASVGKSILGAFTGGGDTTSNFNYDFSYDTTDMFSSYWHSGGRIGDPSFSGKLVPAELFAGALRYHRGGPILAPGEVPVIAQTGERVLSRTQNAEYERGSGPVNLTVVMKNESSQEMQAKNHQTQWSGDMRSAVVTIMLDAVNRNYMGARDALGRG